MQRSDSIEVRRRIDQVYTMLLSGLDSRQIVQYAAEHWDISDRRAREYIAKANELFEQAAHPKRERELGRALMRLDRMYAAALKVQDLRTCLSVQKEISALLGLYAPTRTDITSDGRAIGVVFNQVEPRKTSADD